MPGRTRRSRQRLSVVSSPTMPNGREVELHVLLVGVMRRVIAGDAVDRAVGEAVERAPRGPRSERSGGFILVLVEKPLLRHLLVGEDQVVGRRPRR